MGFFATDVRRAGERVRMHLYGHSHGTLPGTAASIDVEGNCFGFRPVAIDEIRVRLAENADAEGGGS
ncbi:hypothetical protein CJNNKLLH_3324 [Methylorubrum thiocyanatum]|nr:hypothetical protein CJNNKLLH_3324 [Methylorubrum thiocyanatum]